MVVTKEGYLESIDSSDVKDGHLIIPEGVKVISNLDFDGFIKRITIPEGVIRIDNYAFEGKDIIGLKIPESLMEIGEGAFYDNSIKHIYIPECVSKIGNSAFSCNKISKITIENSGICIEDSVFDENPIREINVSINDISITLRKEDLSKIIYEDGDIDSTLIVKLAKLKRLLRDNNEAYDKINRHNCTDIFEILEKLIKSKKLNISKTKTMQPKQPIRYNFG